MQEDVLVVLVAIYQGVGQLQFGLGAWLGSDEGSDVVIYRSRSHLGICGAHILAVVLIGLHGHCLYGSGLCDGECFVLSCEVVTFGGGIFSIEGIVYGAALFVVGDYHLHALFLKLA